MPAPPPSPEATTPGRSRNMAAIRRRDTKFELEVRSRLHHMGLRYRVDLPIRLEGLRPIRPDIVFTRRRLAIFCDGCFWHGCPKHGVRPNVRNGHYWTPKIAGNQARDRLHTSMLEAAGWTVLRFWEHEDAADIAERIRERVGALSAERDATSSDAGRAS